MQTVVALREVRAPGYGLRITYSTFDVLPPINNFGQVAFEVRIDGLGINTNSINGLGSGPLSPASWAAKP